MNSLYLYSTPIVGAAIGYFTNWLAIKMIFRPYEEKRIFGLKVPFTPGLIAVERKRITDQIGFVVTNHLLTNEDLENKILSFDLNDNVRKIINSIENEINNSELTFEDLLKQYLADDYENKLMEVKNLIKFNLVENNSIKTEVELQKLEKDVKNVLPELLNIIKAVFENDLYSIDEILTSFFDDMLSGLFQGLGAFLGGFISSEKIYSLLKNKVVTSIENDYDQIEEKIIEVIYKNNDTEKYKFEIDKIIDTVVNNLLSKNINCLTPMFSILKQDNVVDKISITLKSYFASEINTILSKINIKDLIIEKMNLMPLSEIEDLIMKIAKKEIKAITNIGGVLGFLIGLVSILIY